MGRKIIVVLNLSLNRENFNLIPDAQCFQLLFCHCNFYKIFRVSIFSISIPQSGQPSLSGQNVVVVVICFCTLIDLLRPTKSNYTVVSHVNITFFRVQKYPCNWEILKHGVITSLNSIRMMEQLRFTQKCIQHKLKAKRISLSTENLELKDR